MNIDPEDSAYPHGTTAYHGLTKREIFAAMALQGMLSNGFMPDLVTDDCCPENPDGTRAEWNYPKAAVQLADALIAELNRVKPG